MPQNSVHARPEQENSEKNSNKIQKTIKPIPDIIFSEHGWDKPKKWKQNFTPEFRSYPTRAKNSEKNSKKIQKIVKPLPGIIFSQYGMR